MHFACLTFISSVSSCILFSRCATAPSRGQFWVCRNYHSSKNASATSFLPQHEIILPIGVSCCWLSTVMCCFENEFIDWNQKRGQQLYCYLPELLFEHWQVEASSSKWWLNNKLDNVVLVFEIQNWSFLKCVDQCLILNVLWDRLSTFWPNCSLNDANAEFGLLLPWILF